MSHMNMLHLWESYHMWIKHVTYEWVMSHMNTGMSHVTQEGVISYVNESCHIWMSRISYKYTNESYYTWRGHITYEWVMSRMIQSCHVRMSHITHEWVIEWVIPHMNGSCLISVDERVKLHRRESYHVGTLPSPVLLESVPLGSWDRRILFLMGHVSYK